MRIRGSFLERLELELATEGPEAHGEEQSCQRMLEWAAVYGQPVGWFYCRFLS